VPGSRQIKMLCRELRTLQKRQSSRGRLMTGVHVRFMSAAAHGGKNVWYQDQREERPQRADITR
jgi:hypothetical protein